MLLRYTLSSCWNCTEDKAWKFTGEIIFYAHQNRNINKWRWKVTNEYNFFIIIKRNFYTLICKLNFLETGGLFMLAVRLMQLFSDNKSDFSKIAGIIGLIFQIRDDYGNLMLKEVCIQQSLFFSHKFYVFIFFHHFLNKYNFCFITKIIIVG